MKTKSDIVVAGDGSGKEVPVEVVICTKCSDNFFTIYYINGDPDQMHIQCAHCGTSFCGHAGECSPEAMN